MAKRKIKLTPKVEKFALGDFVTTNNNVVSQYNNQLQNIAPVQNNTVNSALSTMGTGASIGSAFAPGIGTAIGAGIGLLGGAITGIIGNNKAEEARQKQINDINFKRHLMTQDVYNSTIDTNNENPYGVYEDGGEVKPKYKSKRNRNTIKAGQKQANKIIKNSDGDTIFENVLEFIDPTGITSWDDVYRTIGDGKKGTTTTEVLGALPLVGKATKSIKAGKSLSPHARLLLNTPIAGRIYDGVSDFQNLFTTYEDGGDVKNKNKNSRTPYKFMQDYIQSPKYKERIEGGLYWDDTDKVISDRLNRIKSADIKFVNKIPSNNDISINGDADHYNNSISISKSPVNAKPDEVLAHELSHLSGGLNPEWDVANYVPKNAKLSNRDAREIKKRATKQNEYLGEPGEIKARLDELRYMLKRDGIYDAGTQDFNQEHLDKAFKKYSKDNPDLFQGVQSEEDLIWLMNNIASNNTMNNIPRAEDGGDINSTIINIEKGELQIDPESGKILREFTGINPQTGGLYKYHSSKGDDPIDNFVTAKEGTFIITKSQSKKYKDAVDNNDKLYQNSIMQNIRNRKRKLSLNSEKFATGGEVNPRDYFSNWLNNTNLNAVSPTANITFNAGPNSIKPIANTSSPNLSTGPDYLGLATNLLGYGTGIYNMIKGSQAPNYQEFRPLRMDVAGRRRILDNLPQDVSVNPALNQVRRSRNNAYRAIDQGTSNSAIARANKLGLENTFIDAENEAYYNNTLMNNQIRGQRASILSGLSQQDSARDMANAQMLGQVEEINRNLGLAREQQLNTGVSQLIQNFQNNRFINRQQNNDRLRWKILQDMNPYMKYYANDWEQYFNR